MRNLLAFLAALTLTVIGVGWYLDWYHLRRTPAPDGQPSVTVDIDTRKISKDLIEAEHRIQKKLEEKARSTQEEANRTSKTPAIPMPPPPPANVGVFIDP
jgi:hypothetical protein